MNPTSALAVSVATAAALLCACSAYDAKYDEIDADGIFADDKLFHSYVDCLLDQGPCDVQYAAEYRRILPEVIETGCAKCTPKQAENVRKTVMAMQTKLPDKLKELDAKYDPKGEFKEKFAIFLVKA